MTTIPYIPVYPSDFLGETAHLNAEATGAVMLIRSVCWISEVRGESVPDDDTVLARICRMSPARFARKIRPAIQSCFDRTGGVWRHLGQSAKLEEIQARRAVSQTNGAKGGRPRNAQKTDEKIAENDQRNDAENESVFSANPLINNETENLLGFSGITQSETLQLQLQHKEEESPYNPPSKPKASRPKAGWREVAESHPWWTTFCDFVAAFPERVDGSVKSKGDPEANWKAYRDLLNAKGGPTAEQLQAVAIAYARERAAEVAKDAGAAKYTRYVYKFLRSDDWKSFVPKPVAEVVSDERQLWVRRVNNFFEHGIWGSGEWGNKPTAKAGVKAPADLIEAGWRSWIEQYAASWDGEKYTAPWRHWLGSAPGTPLCSAPLQILQEHGIDMTMPPAAVHEMLERETERAAA
jgi:uncharacterized protein YdaU (DUF1376 family)